MTRLCASLDAGCSAKRRGSLGCAFLRNSQGNPCEGVSPATVPTFVGTTPSKVAAPRGQSPTRLRAKYVSMLRMNEWGNKQASVRGISRHGGLGPVGSASWRRGRDWSTRMIDLVYTESPTLKRPDNYGDLRINAAVLIPRSGNASTNLSAAVNNCSPLQICPAKILVQYA